MCQRQTAASGEAVELGGMPKAEGGGWTEEEGTGHDWAK